MLLKDRVTEDMKSAMKSGDKERLETVRSIRASILEFEKSGIDRDMTEEDGLDILNKLAKKRRDSIDMYKKAGREELANKEENELTIITEYLPKQMSREEIEDLVDSVLDANSFNQPSDMGKAMGKLMPMTKGKADGNMIKEIVKDRLSPR